MTTPDYAIEFFNITITVTATILGFSIVSWVFWWENLGKNIKFEIESKITYYYFKNGYKKLEEIFLRYFLRANFPIFNKTYGEIFKFTKFDLLYRLIKQKTDEWVYITETKKVNIVKLVFFMFILFLIAIGVYYIGLNVFLIRITTKFTLEELTEDPTFQSIISNSFIMFLFFIGAFTIFISAIISHSFYYKKSKLRKSRYDFDYIQ